MDYVSNDQQLLKPSDYNYYMALPDQTTLFFNFFTLNLLIYKGRDASKAISLLNGNCHLNNVDLKKNEIHHQLIKNGFFIKKTISELEILRQWHNQARGNSQHLNLTIIPTLKCNFRCTYCYQEHFPITMDHNTQEALTRFIQKKIVNNGSLHITWFGGEPLLEVDIIELLSRKFKAICDENNTKYSAKIITNGYLFCSDVANRLKDCSITQAQITLDGPADIHDLRRPYIDGSKTYEKIINNLKEAAPIIPVSLRINVDQTNREKIGGIVNQIKEMGLKDFVHPYLGQTYPYTNTCSDISSECLTDFDFSLLTLETTLELIEQGFHSFPLPRAVSAHCMAEKANSFVITPEGMILKCWNEASEPEAAVGHLTEPQNKNMVDNNNRWFQRDIFSLDCKDCKLLPICMGGCPYIFNKTGHLHCHSWKYNLDESLATYYYLKALENEGQIATAFEEAVVEMKSFLEGC